MLDVELPMNFRVWEHKAEGTSPQEEKGEGHGHQPLNSALHVTQHETKGDMVSCLSYFTQPGFLTREEHCKEHRGPLFQGEVVGADLLLLEQSGPEAVTIFTLMVSILAWL